MRRGNRFACEFLRPSWVVASLPCARVARPRFFIGRKDKVDRAGRKVGKRWYLALNCFWPSQFNLSN